jgi:anti-anti-sigma factor
VGVLREFLVTTEQGAEAVLIGCSGELDLATCPRLEEALAMVLAENPSRLVFDGSEISLLSSPGIRCLFGLSQICKQRGIQLELKFSDEARRVLDLVGLWWLGVLDDGPAVEQSLRDALRAYGRLSPELRNGAPTTAEEGSGHSDYFIG